MEENSTPLNYTKLNLADFNAPQIPEFGDKQVPARAKRMGPGNVFLAVSVLAFVFSVSYYVQSSKFATSSRASSNVNPTGAAGMMNIDEKTLLPRAYNDEDISSAIVEDLRDAAKAEQVKFADMYVKDKLLRYYIYKDVMAKHGLSLPDEQNTEQKVTPEKIQAMEQIIKDNLVSTADFAYIVARFKILNKQSELEKTYGNLDERAKAVIGRYEQLFIDPSYTVDQVIDVSNKDAELMALTNDQKNAVITNYSGDNQTFVLDPSFPEFLYSLKVNEVSDLHTMTTEDGQAFGYAIVYPTRIEKREFNTLNDIIKQNVTNFIY